MGPGHLKFCLKRRRRARPRAARGGERESGVTKVLKTSFIHSGSSATAQNTVLARFYAGKLPTLLRLVLQPTLNEFCNTSSESGGEGFRGETLGRTQSGGSKDTQQSGAAVVATTGESGEVQVRGIGVCGGYYEFDGENTDDSISTPRKQRNDDWFSTGDLGYLDSAGA
jgi:acyl-CoA synthetase (AMP-forming)/AMP-acid ligase II